MTSIFCSVLKFCHMYFSSLLFLVNCCSTQNTIEQVCRLARTIASPHNDTSHCYLVAEGCPSRANSITTLAACVAGFEPFKLRCSSASPANSSNDGYVESFKADLVRLYLRAGVKVNRFSLPIGLFVICLSQKQILQKYQLYAYIISCYSRNFIQEKTFFEDVFRLRMRHSYGDDHTATLGRQERRYEIRC